MYIQEGSVQKPSASIFPLLTYMLYISEGFLSLTYIQSVRKTMEILFVSLLLTYKLYVT